MVPHGDRSGVVIEPWLTDQWYVDAHTLAQPAIQAVETGATAFEPARTAVSTALSMDFSLGSFAVVLMKLWRN